MASLEDKETLQAPIKSEPALKKEGNDPEPQEHNFQRIFYRIGMERIPHNLSPRLKLQAAKALQRRYGYQGLQKSIQEIHKTEKDRRKAYKKNSQVLQELSPENFPKEEEILLKGEGGAIKEEVVAQDGFKGQAISYPHKNAVENALGLNLTGVQAHIGAKAAEACQDLSAEAYTYQGKVAFNSATPSFGTAVHEAVHIAQQSGISLSGENSATGSSTNFMEKEAYSIERQVTSGSTIAHKASEIKSETSSPSSQESLKASDADSVGALQLKADPVKQMTEYKLFHIAVSYQVSGFDETTNPNGWLYDPKTLKPICLDLGKRAETMHLSRWKDVLVQYNLNPQGSLPAATITAKGYAHPVKDPKGSNVVKGPFGFTEDVNMFTGHKTGFFTMGMQTLTDKHWAEGMETFYTELPKLILSCTGGGAVVVSLINAGVSIYDIVKAAKENKTAEGSVEGATLLLETAAGTSGLESLSKTIGGIGTAIGACFAIKGVFDNNAKGPGTIEAAAYEITARIMAAQWGSGQLAQGGMGSYCKVKAPSAGGHFKVQEYSAMANYVFGLVCVGLGAVLQSSDSGKLTKILQSSDAFYQFEKSYVNSEGGFFKVDAEAWLSQCKNKFGGVFTELVIPKSGDKK